jgi:stage V sporulation protein SpoVS
MIGAILGFVNRTFTKVSQLATDYTTSRATNLDNLDAAITSRPAGSDYTAGRASNLDNLDAAVSSRATTASITSATLKVAPNSIQRFSTAVVIGSHSTVASTTVNQAISSVVLANSYVIFQGITLSAIAGEGSITDAKAQLTSSTNVEVIASSIAELGSSFTITVTVHFAVIEWG